MCSPLTIQEIQIKFKNSQLFSDQLNYLFLNCLCKVAEKSLLCWSPGQPFEMFTPINREVSFPPGQLIERVLLSSMLNPGEQWQTYRHHSRMLSLEYRLRFRCDSNYFGPFCNKFCRARDDFFGHFNCDPSGSKVCMEGWTGPECKEGKRQPRKNSENAQLTDEFTSCLFGFTAK